MTAAISLALIANIVLMGLFALMLAGIVRPRPIGALAIFGAALAGLAAVIALLARQVS